MPAPQHHNSQIHDFSLSLTFNFYLRSDLIVSTDVIVNGDLEEESAPTGETSASLAPKTAKQLTAKRNQE
ncbi:hypothetical protein Tco_0967114 [Tanacetum coccineum]